MKTGYRPKRVGEEIRRILTELIRKGRVHGSTLFDVSIIITEVQCTSDLGFATVYFHPLNTENTSADSFAKALQDNEGFFRRVIGKEMRIRNVPKLIFKYETSFDRADKISKILDDINVDDKKEEI